jgi:hypothetical protein
VKRSASGGYQPPGSERMGRTGHCANQVLLNVAALMIE